MPENIRKRARAWIALLCLSLAIGLLAGCEGAQFTAGDTGLEGTGMGNNGPITVKVVMEGSKIAAVHILSHDETIPVTQIALETLPARIVEAQSFEVDTIAGATGTSRGILEAVRQALLSAGYDSGLFENPLSPRAEAAQYSADVIIVGAGGAGLCAAVEAHKNGASVIVLEKTTTVGGNTAISTGLYNAVDPKRQQAQGIRDSLQQHFDDTYDGGDRLADPALVWKLVNEAYEGLCFYEALGLKFREEMGIGVGGLQFRGHYPARNGGGEYIRVLKAYCDQHNILIVREAKAERLIIENGRVAGVVVNRDGVPLTARARGGVVLATGGFGENVTMRQVYDPRLTLNVPCSNTPATMGDGIIMAQAVNANTVGMEYIQLFPIADMESGSLSVPMPGGTQYGIWINAEGRRFVAEDGRRDHCSEKIWEQTGRVAYVLLDSGNSTTEQDRAFLSGLVDIGRVKKADSIEEMAVLLSMEADNLEETVARYNAAVKTGADAQFGRKLLLSEISVPPFYVTANTPSVHTTLGGVQIDSKARVMDTNGNPIFGLYAAGEVTGGIHGANRLGANALTEITVFGRTAGRNAAIAALGAGAEEGPAA